MAGNVKDGRCPGTATVCLIKKSDISPSETFVRAHLDRLPTQVVPVIGIPPCIHGKPVGRNLLARISGKLRRLTGSASSTSDLTTTYQEVFRSRRPAVVLAEYGPAGVNVLEACTRTGVPLVVHFHGYDATNRPLLNKYAVEYRGLFEHATAIVAVSCVMRRDLINLGASAERVFVNPCGVDCAAFTPGDMSYRPPTFLSVGRFVDKKAPHLLLLAFKEVYELNPEARLRMIGDGKLFAVCRDLASALKIEEAVAFLGVQSHDVVRDEMSRALAFVQHSVEDHYGTKEGTPVALLEAGASGLPVVATDHAGIPDVVIDGKSGFLVREHDVSGMADRMLRLTRQPELAVSLGRRGRERVSAYFSMDRSIDRLWSILQYAATGANIPPVDFLPDIETDAPYWTSGDPVQERQVDVR